MLSREVSLYTYDTFYILKSTIAENLNASKTRSISSMTVQSSGKCPSILISAELWFFARYKQISQLILWTVISYIVTEARYISIQLQSNLIFGNQTYKTFGTVFQVLGCIRYFPREAPEKYKLLAYTGRLILEYGDISWHSARLLTKSLLTQQQSSPLLQKH